MNSKVHRKKLHLGLIYGLVAGLAFSVFAWGIDAWILARANDSFFWVKFIPGLILCCLAGGVIGFLTILLHRHALALLLWGLLAGLFTWLVVWLPFSGAPRLITLIDPDLASRFSFSQVQIIGQIQGFSLVIIGLVALITGLLEINLVDQAAVSPYLSGIVMAVLICAILFGLGGSAIDHLINANLREPVQAISTMLQFAQDNAGVEIPKATAREMHLSATKRLGDLIKKPYTLTLSGFDRELGIVDVLVDFDGTQAKCSTIYSQPVDCIILTLNP